MKFQEAPSILSLPIITDLFLRRHQSSIASIKINSTPWEAQIPLISTIPQLSAGDQRK